MLAKGPRVATVQPAYDKSCYQHLVIKAAVGSDVMQVSILCCTLSVVFHTRLDSRNTLGPLVKVDATNLILVSQLIRKEYKAEKVLTGTSHCLHAAS